MSQALVHRTNRQLTNPVNIHVLNGALIVAASLLMAVCAHVSIPLWFTPVPVTLQTFGVMLLALTLGGWRASAALVLYLLEGISGLLVFSPSGPGGIAQIMGPTGGFLMAYPLAALVSGIIAQKLLRSKRPVISFALGALVCDAIIFAAGAIWLLGLTHQSSTAIMAAAVLPFLPGEVLKGAAAVGAALAKTARFPQTRGGLSDEK
jgi:biotin transport system substrate-specific component